MGQEREVGGDGVEVERPFLITKGRAELRESQGNLELKRRIEEAMAVERKRIH